MAETSLTPHLQALYEASDLTVLRRRLSDALADYGYWGVCERTNRLQVTEDYFDLSHYVWDNYASRVGDRRTELLRALLEANAAQGVEEENRRLRWVAGQTRPYVIINGASARFAAHEERCRLVEDFGLHTADHLNLPISNKDTCHRLIWAAAESKGALKNSSEVGGLLTVYSYMSQLITADPDAQLSDFGEAAADGGSDKPVLLKDREREVLRWLAAGKTHRDIAVILGMPVRTVRYHIDQARERYGYATAQQTVVRAALDYGFDPLGGP